MIFAFGKAKRLPDAPPHNRIAPSDIAIPTQIVDTSGLTYCIVSQIASPAYACPPGELI
jgi:hypothetical protein